MRASRYGIALALLVAGVAAGGTSSGEPRGTLAVVAEASHESGGVNYPSDVFVVDVDGRHLRNLTHDGASNGWAQWMPDGRRIVFQSHPSNTERGTWHIFVINSDGTHRRRLTSRIGGSAPDISPDGRRVSYVVQRRRKWDVYVMDSDGRHQRRLRTPHDEWQVGAPTWTPDGRMIFFVRTDWSHGVSSLFLINGDGSGLTRLACARSLSGVALSPTGRTLALEHSDPSASPTGSGDELTIADLRRGSGGLLLRPVKTIRNVWPGAFLWAPDGRTIIYENDAGTWVVDARRPEPRLRFPVQAYLYNLRWSPDRRWLAFSRSRVLATDPIEVATAAGHERRTVTRKICCLLDELAWAPR